MLFTTQRSELLEAVQNLSRIVTKTSLPVLEGILISAEKGKITLVSYNLEMSMKKEIYANCDYISLHIPCTKDTKGSINNAAFAQMKDGVRILNFARGELVNSEE